MVESHISEDANLATEAEGSSQSILQSNLLAHAPTGTNRDWCQFEAQVKVQPVVHPLANFQHIAMNSRFRCPNCGALHDGQVDRCPSCSFGTRAYRLLESRLDEFERRVAALESAIGVGEKEVARARSAPRKAGKHARFIEVAILLGSPIAMLFGAHYFLMTVVGELKPQHMLIASVAIPLPFGFLVASGGLHRFTLWLLGSIALAFVSALGMNVVSTLMHGSDVLPGSAQERWEFMTYVASIALSHAAGLILGVMFWQFVTRTDVSPNRTRWQYRVARFLVGRHYDADLAHRATIELLRIARMLVALAAIAGSFYSGWLRYQA